MGERQYPGIAKAALLISLDNGGINRHRSQKQQQNDLGRFLATQPSDMLEPIDAWLSSLSEDDLYTACCGGQDEPETIALLSKGPPFTNDVLDAYFEAAA